MPEKNTVHSRHIADTLKRMLFDGKLNPGARLSETALSAELGFSRAAVREALQMLMAEGLVVNPPHQGKRIAALTPDEIRNSYFVGGVLEGAAAAVFAHEFNADDFRHMDEILSQMHALLRQGRGMPEFAPLDVAFHNRIFSRIDNPLLVQIARHSCLRISKLLLYRHWLAVYTPKEFYRRHVEVLAALRSRNPQLIETCLRNHYIESGRRLSRFGVSS